MNYPEVRRDDFSEQLHGYTVADPYRYMEQADDPETQRFVQENNEMLQSYLDAEVTANFSRQLEHIVDFDRYSTPTQKGDRIFFQKHSGTKAQPELCVQEGIGGQVRTIIDFNNLSQDGTTAPTAISYSDEGKYTSICLTEHGSDFQEMIILDVDSGEEVDRLTNIRFAIPQWNADATGFYYEKFPDVSSNEAVVGGGNVYYHTLGTSQDQDEDIFSPKTTSDRPSIEVKSDKQHAFLSTYRNSTSGSCIYLMDLKTREITPILDEYQGYNFILLDILDGKIYLKTNYDAPLSQIISLDLDNPSLDAYATVVAESDNFLRNVGIYGQKLIVHYLINAVSALKVFAMDGTYLREIPLPELGTVLGFSGKRDGSHLFVDFTSYPYLPTIYHINLDCFEFSQYIDNRSDFDPSQYIVKQVWFESKDGTKLGMFIVHHKDITLDGKNPCLMWSYGGFNIPLTPGAGLRERYKVRLMIENGGVYACPNIRGGGEYGKAWHKAGTLDQKQNVFDDFIASGEYLIAEGYTSSSLLISHGGSNGGLLVAATLLQRPDLFGCAVGEAGVMDMLRYHKFTFGKYWIGDYGNPDIKEDFEFLIKYSPVHNVKEVEYPPSLFYCADTDTRVVPMHTKKLVAEMQFKQQGDPPILMRTETKAGHNFGKPIGKVIEETAIMFSFIWKSLGLKF